MKYYFLAFLQLAALSFCYSQTSPAWKGYFSYNEVKDLSQSNTTFYAASENAVFSINQSTNVLKTTNTVDGLSAQTITSIYHSPTFNKTLLGYDNGLIILINDADGSVVNFVDIINKQISPTIKKVNHFMEYEGIVYVSCDFGIVQFNMATLNFGDTYFIGNNGAEIIVYQTAVSNGIIFAATNNGIRRASVTNPNLVNFNQWIEITGGVWTGIETFGNELLAVSFAQVFRYNGASFNNFTSYPFPIVDIRQSENYLVISTSDRVYVYNQTLGLAAQVDSNIIPDIDPVFTASLVISDTIYIGTLENGVITTTIGNTANFQFISPDGPIRNNIWAINTTSSNLWAVFGGYTTDYDPSPQYRFGISKYNQDGWLNIPYDEVREPGQEAFSLVRVTVNPANENQIFVSSYYSGLLQFDNDVLTKTYNATNSGLETIFPTDPPQQNIRLEQSVFDREGNLWVTNSILESPLKVFRADGTWQSYEMKSILGDDYLSARFGKMIIDKNGTKWMCTEYDGLVGFNENGNIRKKITLAPDPGNLPTASVRSVAVDNRNQLWIGTAKGLRILSSVDRFLGDEPLVTNPVIILEEDVAQELLYEQFITDIVVDGANNKWIGTADSGVFLLSPNGQETLQRFTSTNSPLPSNSINDIDINGVTGEVFFATTKGLVSFKGLSTTAGDNLNNVVVYPNPVRPGYSGTVKMTGLIDNATIKITDIEGNLVYETRSEGGTIEWDTTAFGKYRVASGVYMIFISAEDGLLTKVKKVMIIR